MKRARAVVGGIVAVVIVIGAASIALREWRSRRMPALTADEAVAAARRDVGIKEAGEAELVVLDGETVPFLRETLRGRRAWRVRFVGPLPAPLDGWKGAALDAVLDPDSGIVLRVDVARPGAEPSGLTVEMEERDLESSSQRFRRVVHPPAAAFFPVLRDVDVMRRIAVSREVRAYLVSDPESVKLNYWSVDVLGIPVDPASQPRGPPPGIIVPVAALDCWQLRVDAATGSVLSEQNLPR